MMRYAAVAHGIRMTGHWSAITGETVAPPWEGFWQVVYNDAEEEIVDYPALYTTMALRRVGFSIYAGGWFVEIRRQPDDVHPSVGQRQTQR